MKLEQTMQVIVIMVMSGLLISAGFRMGKAPWVEAGALKCEYTFPTLETRIDE